jgi:hypothetical protein
MALTKATLSMIKGATINAADYGASATASAAANTTALQNALNSLSAGGTLVISEDLDINNEISIPYNDITIAGDSRPLITQTVAGLRVFYGESLANITISNIKIDGTDSSVAYNGDAVAGNAEGAIHIKRNGTNPTNIRIFDCEFYNVFTAISCVYVGNLWIERNLIRNFYKFGILASSSYNFHIDHNNIYTCENETSGNSYGIQATGGSATGDIQQRCSISFNAIDYVRIWDGIMCHDVDDIIITGNHITNIRAGIDLSYSSGTATSLENIIVSSNYIELTTTDVLSGAAANSSGILIVGDNDVDNFIERVIIADNIIKDANQMTGFTSVGDAAGAIQIDTVKNLTVSGNIIDNFGNEDTAMKPIGVFYPRENVRIEGNQIEGSFSTDAISVYTQDTSLNNAFSVQNNTITTSNATGISNAYSVALSVAGSGTTATFNNLSITGNTTNCDKKDYYVESGITLTIAEGDGTFIPQLEFGGASVGMTSSSNASFTKRGNKLFFNISITLTAKGSSTGSATITGLPFSAISTPTHYPLSIYNHNMASISGQIIPAVQGTLNYVSLYQESSSSTVSLDNTNFTDTSRISVQGYIDIT